MSDLLFARQPMFDADLEAQAYELLFRTAEGAGPAPLDGDIATSQVIMKAFVDLEQGGALSGKPAHINIGPGLLRSFAEDTLPPKSVVLDLTPDVPAEPGVLELLARLHAAGHVLAIPEPAEQPAFTPLMPYARVIKLDAGDGDATRLAARKQALAPTGAQLIVTRIETHATFDAACKVGFDLFQGYFLCRPRPVTGSVTQASSATVMQLLAQVSTSDVDFDELDRLIRLDVGMSYRLLRIVNSSYYNLPRAIRSIRQALGLLGTRQIRQWVSLMAMAGLDDRPSAVFSLAITRARMCENLAVASGLAEPASAFVCGLFSALDAMVDRPLEVVLGDLPLDADLAAALLTGEGPLGEMLTCTLAQERCAFRQLRCTGMTPWEIQDAYLEALKWAGDVQNRLSKAPAAV